MKRYYDPIVFDESLDGIDLRRHVIGTYYVEDEVPGEDFIDHFSLVQSIVIEGSTGTWQEIKEESPEIRRHLTGKVAGYYEIPSDGKTKKAVIQLAFPIDAWNGNVPMILLSLAGNCYAYSPKMRLLDIFFPEDLVKMFKGPKFGVSGIRKMLRIKERPLSLHIIKPKMGMTPKQVAKQVYQTALGGADMCKDDEMTSDVYHSKFEDRIEAVMEVLNQAEKKTGKKVIYFVSITDEVSKMVEKAKRAIKLGANGLLMAYSAGPSILRTLAEDPEINVPLFMHPSHMMALLPRISVPALCKICRLCGADLMLTPTYWSSIPVVSHEEGIRAAQVSLAPLFQVRRTWPMPAAGMYPGLVPILIGEFGPDIVIPAGGGMLGHPMGYAAGAKAWQQAIEAAMDNLPLERAALERPELKAAMEKWGTITRPEVAWLRTAPKYHPRPMKFDKPGSTC